MLKSVCKTVEVLFSTCRNWTAVYSWERAISQETRVIRRIMHRQHYTSVLGLGGKKRVYISEERLSPVAITCGGQDKSKES